MLGVLVAGPLGVLVAGPVGVLVLVRAYSLPVVVPVAVPVGVPEVVLAFEVFVGVEVVAAELAMRLEATSAQSLLRTVTHF